MLPPGGKVGTDAWLLSAGKPNELLDLTSMGLLILINIIVKHYWKYNSIT